MDPQLKVSRAVTRLVLKYPFFGSCALGLNIVKREDLSPPTMATDGRSIFWDENFVNKLTEEEVTGVIAHEVMHVVMKHPLRLEGRDMGRANKAMDYAINPIVKDEASLTLPEDCLYDPKYFTMSFEKIYNLLIDEEEQGGGGGSAPQWGGVMVAKNEDGSEMTEADKQQMEAAIDQKVMMAAAAAKSIGNLPNSVDEMVKKMREPKVDFRDVMKRFVGGDQPDDYSWRRPNKRMFHQVRVVGPSIGRVGCGHVTCIVDTSGSMADGELQQALGEINNLSVEFSPERLNVITFDTKVRTVQEYAGGEEVTDIKVGSRGGTDVIHVFDYLNEHQIKTDIMIFITDMGFHNYPEQPSYPVLWVNTDNNSTRAPWGDQVNIIQH